jgi:hypothetical protein
VKLEMAFSAKPDDEKRSPIIGMMHFGNSPAYAKFRRQTAPTLVDPGIRTAGVFLSLFLG